MVYLYWNNKKEVQLISTELQKNSVILGQTDTVIGLFAKASKEGFDRLNQLKTRYEKPYLLLAANQEQVRSFVDPDFFIQNELFFKKVWPGPVTLILKAKKGLPVYIGSLDGTVAFRIPAHQGLLELLEQTGPLFSTSANISGRQVPDLLRNVEESILQHVTYIVQNNDAALHECIIASTILDLTGPLVKVIRKGAYDISTLESLYGKTFII